MPRISHATLANRSNVIKDARGWNVHSAEMRTLLGLGPKAKLPAAGLPTVVIQGIEVTVLSLEDARATGHFHRVTAKCPHCGAILSAGRLHQHVCK